MHHGKMFDDLCEQYGVTKAHVARKLNVDDRTIQRWLKQQSWPLDRVVKVSRVLRIDPNRFITPPASVASESVAV